MTGLFLGRAPFDQGIGRSAKRTATHRLTLLTRFGRICRTSIVVLVVGSVSSICDGQTPDTSPPDSLRGMLSPPKPVQLSREDSLKALIETTERLRLERLAEENGPASTSPATSNTSAEAGSSQNLQTFDSSASQATENTTAGRSLTEIRERIRILQRLRRESQTNDSVAPSEVNPTPAPLSETMEVSQSSPSASQNELAERAIHSLQSDTNDSTSPNAATVPVDEPQEIVSQQILPTAANAFALGESLYRMGNYDAALKALLTVDVSQLPQSDRTWLDLTIALCRRKMGDTDKALGTLREIANEKSTDYPVRAAKWWLKHADATLATKNKLDAVNAEIDLLLERANQNVKGN